jgi:hypothetical protein
MSKHLIALAVLVATSSFAEERQGPPRGPPAEAIAACNGLQTDAACSFTHEGRALTGTCFAPQGRPAACRPAGHRGPPPGQDGAR